ncbi:BtrH N-terminal domain-containing protein [Fluviicola sp.]|uniref:BtrH N-terminal domain-containing protein n=1 Tax=Fluviicola sp. TaxID=1917219 RepID=UPI0031E077B6
MSEFIHHQTAHCENGVTMSLLQHHGVDFMTEPLAFGMGSGLFYIHIPFMKVNNGPAISFRTMPGAIFKRTCKALDVKVERRKFKDPKEATRFLDEKIAQGIQVGCQVGVFHLPYFPKEYRFHFNAHNLIVFGKEGDRYLVSDPVMEVTTSLSTEELERVRFAKGALAPKGHIYYPVEIGNITQEQVRRGIAKGIKRNCRDMLKIPGGIAGVKGIVHTANKIRTWRDKLGPRQAGLHLGQIVRMQEEIGTGGGGFRFLYAAFLEEAAVIMQNEQLAKVSETMTKAGDLWRDSALQMSGIYKGRITEQKDFDACADLLVEISAVEKQAFQELAKIKF